MSLNRTLKLSHRAIEQLAPPAPDWPSNNLEYTDTVESGLKVVVYRTGKKFFRHRFTFEGSKKMMSLGEFPAVNLERARERVRENKAKLAEGVNPLVEIPVDEAITLGRFVETSFIPYAKKERRSFRDILSRLNKRILPVFGDRPIKEIRRQEVAAFHLELGNDVAAPTANRTVATVSAIFNLAVNFGVLDSNPARGIRKLKENGPRERVLAGEELSRFMAALQDELHTVSGQVIYMLITTGLRRGEILGMRWENVKFEDQTAYLPTTKCGKSRWVPLNSVAIDMLRRIKSERGMQSPFVFPGDGKKGHLIDPRKSLWRVMEKAGISDLHCHDLRRAYASLLCNAGVATAEIQSLLGHQNIATTQIYARLNQRTLHRASETAVDELRKVMYA